MMATSESERRREARRRAAHRRTEPDAAPAGETAIRSKPVRITVDLAPELYRRFTAWSLQAATELDMPKVTHAEVIRAFIRAADDPDIARRIIAELRKGKESA
jgi:hypothetical protein